MSLNVVLCKMNTVADEIIPPLSLGYLAAAAPLHKVVILDAQKENLNFEKIIEFCKQNGTDVLGVQVWTKDLRESRDLFRFMKKFLPKITIVVGGVQTSVMPLDTAEFYGDCVDFFFEGESELGFPKFLDELKKNLSGEAFDYSTVPSLLYREGRETKRNQTQIIKNLDDIPLPRWDLMPPNKYPQAPHGAFFKQYPFAPIMTSRGCPYGCTFCSAPVLSERKIRFRSISNIFQEIDILHNQYGIKELHIEDDNFSLNKKFVMEFCDAMRKTGYGMTWAFPNGIRLDTLDDEVLAAMKEAGCYSMNFGIEAGSDETLRRIKKQITVETIREKVAVARKYGFRLGGFFILGFPWEGEKDIEETIKLALSLDLDVAGFSYFQPFPGTEIAKELSNSGEFAINLEDFSTSLHTISYVPRGLSVEKMKELRQSAMRRFYFRPRIFFRILRSANSAQHYFYIFKRAIRWLTR